MNEELQIVKASLAENEREIARLRSIFKYIDANTVSGKDLSPAQVAALCRRALHTEDLPPYYMYPVPRETHQMWCTSPDGALADPVVPVQDITIQLASMDMHEELWSVENAFYKATGSKPGTFLLGWRAFLCFQTQCRRSVDYHGNGLEFHGIPVTVSGTTHPWSRSATLPLDRVLPCLAQLGVDLGGE